MFHVCSRRRKRRHIRLGHDRLLLTALLALEEATHECRYGPVRKTFGLRLALGYLWSSCSGDRAPFDAFWRSLEEEGEMWRFDHADRALDDIHGALGITRDRDLSMRIWMKVYDRRDPPGTRPKSRNG